jgi:hypothetical protein
VFVHNVFYSPCGERISTNELDNVDILFPIFREKSIPRDRKSGYQKVAVNLYSGQLQLPLYNEEANGDNFSEN